MRARTSPSIQREIGRRIAEFRESLRYSQADFAPLLRIKKERLASYESGRVPLPWGVYQNFYNEVRISAPWLATGEGHPLAPMPEKWRTLRMAQVPRETPFHEVWTQYRAELTPTESPVTIVSLFRAAKGLVDQLQNLSTMEPEARKRVLLEPGMSGLLFEAQIRAEMAVGDAEDAGAPRMLHFGSSTREDGGLKESTERGECKNKLYKEPEISDASHMPKPTTSLWVKLRDRIRDLTQPRGEKANLARRLEVSPQVLNAWLSGASAPPAHITLWLKEWADKQ